jgi:hypothetical protein
MARSKVGGNTISNQAAARQSSDIAFLASTAARADAGVRVVVLICGCSRAKGVRMKDRAAQIM